MSARRRGNPADSPWYSTPDDARGRPSVKLTLPREVLEKLERLASLRGMSRSAVVESLILAAK